MGKGLLCAVRVCRGSGCMDADACNYDANRQMPTAVRAITAARNLWILRGSGPCQGETAVIVPRPQLSGGGGREPMLVRRKPAVHGIRERRCDRSEPADADEWSRLRPMEGTGTVTTGLFSYDAALLGWRRMAAFYSGHAVLDARSLCPSGWAVPTSPRFCTNLINTGFAC